MDTKVNQLVSQEEKRQQETISLIPSENYASKAVRDLVGSVLMNKYSEGYSNRRYYQGNDIIDSIELLAIERAKELFGVPHANVQPYSGSPANSAVLFAIAEPQDTIIGLELSSGGHLTHGHPKITFSGKFFNSVQFGFSEQYKKISSDIVNNSSKSESDIKRDSLIDYTELDAIVKKNNPKVMIIGTTAYPQILDWQRLGEIADTYGSYLVADVSHIAGLIVSGEYPSPVSYAHVVTTTTHKTLRGPRGAMIMVTQKGLEKDPELNTKIDRAVFPGLQGGPHDNTTAAIAQTLYEASQKEFKEYAKQIVANAKVLAKELIVGGQKLVGDGTECHLLLVDLSPLTLSGNVVAEALEVAGIITNRNSIPGDLSPFYPSGLRLGTPAVTTRGIKEEEMKIIAKYILQVIEHVKDEKLPTDPKDRSAFIKDFKVKISKDKFLIDIASEIKSLCAKFPMP
jgi:glycine hydroxymethyltransferase